jgi:hypothetical protein
MQFLYIVTADCQPSPSWYDTKHVKCSQLLAQGKSVRTVQGHLLESIGIADELNMAQLASDLQMGPGGSVSSSEITRHKILLLRS